MSITNIEDVAVDIEGLDSDTYQKVCRVFEDYGYSKHKNQDALILKYLGGSVENWVYLVADTGGDEQQAWKTVEFIQDKYILSPEHFFEVFTPTLRKGDYVDISNMDVDTYHKVATKFLLSGADKVEYPDIDWLEEFDHFGWGRRPIISREGLVHWYDYDVDDHGGLRELSVQQVMNCTLPIVNIENKKEESPFKYKVGDYVQTNHSGIWKITHLPGFYKSAPSDYKVVNKDGETGCLNDDMVVDVTTSFGGEEETMYEYQLGDVVECNGNHWEIIELPDPARSCFEDHYRGRKVGSGNFGLLSPRHIIGRVKSPEFPLEGDECMISNCGNPWKWCKISYKGPNLCVVDHGDGDDQHYHLNSVEFRSLSDEDIVVRDIQRVLWRKQQEGATTIKMAEAIYKEGYRKGIPEV